MKFIRLIQDL